MQMKKIIAVFLAAIMLFSVMPLAASAVYAVPKTTTINGETYYKVGTVEELKWLSDCVNSNSVKEEGDTPGDINVILTNNIDLAGVTWVPIGKNAECSFKGVFDGANFTISNLNSSDGLFGYISGAAVKNVTVSGELSPSSGCVGMIAGQTLDSLIYNCKAVGKINFEFNGNNTIRFYLGGVVGAALHSVVINCAAQTDIDVNVNSSQTNIEYATVGGVAGVATVASQAPFCLLNSYCAGDISVKGNKVSTPHTGRTARFCVGGIAGYLEDDAVNNYYSGTITDKDGAESVKEIGYAFGYVAPEYTISTTTNGTTTSETGTMVIKKNYYPAGKTAIGAIATDKYDSTGWTTAAAADADLVAILNANTGEVEQIINDHREILKGSAWSDIVEAANGDAVTVSEWEKGEDNLPVLSDTEIVGEPVVDDPVVPECNHMCHKGGFMGFIWTIVRFFQKAFGTNPVCECGAAHY